MSSLLQLHGGCSDIHGLAEWILNVAMEVPDRFSLICLSPLQRLVLVHFFLCRRNVIKQRGLDKGLAWHSRRRRFDGAG